MVKCPECGENLTSEDKTCPNCGHSLSEDNKSSSKKNTSFNSKIIAVIAVVVIIVAVGIFASGMLSDNNSSSDVDSSESDTSVEPINEDNSTSNAEADEYWSSEKSDKFHLPTCEWAEKISEDNKIIYQTREDAIEDGKEPCGVCNP